MIIFLCLFIFGCITIETKGERTVIDPWKKIEEKIADFWKKLKGEKTEEQVGTREEATKKYEYKGLKEELIVEPPIITPKVVKPGDIVKQKLRYSLLAPQKEREFNVSETVSLSSGKEKITELMERSSKKVQGTHLSTVKFTIPADLNPGVYTLITVLNIGEQKKTVSESFNLLEKQLEAGSPSTHKSTPTPEAKDTDFIVAGKLYLKHGEKEIENLIPLVVFSSGKYSSAWEALETNNPFKQKVLSTDKFWLYYKGTLIGNFKVSGFKSPSEETMFQPSLTGRIYWEIKPSVELEKMGENTIALSQQILQPFYPKDLVLLDTRQKSELDRILKETFRKATTLLAEKFKKEGFQYKYFPQAIKTYIYRDMKTMDLNRDGQPELYLYIKWGKDFPDEEPNTTILLTWKDNNWTVLRHSTYIAYESLPTAGEKPFSIEVVTDIDGDGIAELILEERTGYEVWSLKLYQLRNKQLEKILDIGEYGL